jgi:anti-sigma factor RsiW
MAEERVAGGLRCGEVLSLLSGYVDGELSNAERERIESHLRGCDVCERFGGEFSETVAALRRRLADPGSIDGGVADRLRRRLESERDR